ncbi:hypothetical protein CUN61_10910 [Pseudomonas arsenicoxydans]|uniref:Uncharacterized protein n=1 Tax=Pseudomonas arsenicoxydans TaxID=702115 RepID=A0A4P6FZS7_9PSED|nr:hypothetical protein CUN61_10910 [Pseudomonas arsenicoxydans]
MGASLLAIASVQSAIMLNVLTPSRAGSLPHWLVFSAWDLRCPQAIILRLSLPVESPSHFNTPPVICYRARHRLTSKNNGQHC